MERVFRGGEIITGNRRDEVFEACLVRDGRVVIVGRESDVAALTCDGAEVYDLTGRSVIPGFFTTAPLNPTEADGELGRVLSLIVGGGAVTPPEAGRRVVLGDAEKKDLDRLRGSLEWGKTADLIVLSSSLSAFGAGTGAPPAVAEVFCAGEPCGRGSGPA